jgi:hypothetical protein
MTVFDSVKLTLSALATVAFIVFVFWILSIYCLLAGQIIITAVVAIPFGYGWADYIKTKLNERRTTDV